MNNRAKLNELFVSKDSSLGKGLSLKATRSVSFVSVPQGDLPLFRCLIEVDISGAIELQTSVCSERCRTKISAEETASASTLATINKTLKTVSGCSLMDQVLNLLKSELQSVELAGDCSPERARAVSLTLSKMAEQAEYLEKLCELTAPVDVAAKCKGDVVA